MVSGEDSERCRIQLYCRIGSEKNCLMLFATWCMDIRGYWMMVYQLWLRTCIYAGLLLLFVSIPGGQTVLPSIPEITRFLFHVLCCPSKFPSQTCSACYFGTVNIYRLTTLLPRLLCKGCQLKAKELALFGLIQKIIRRCSNLFIAKDRFLKKTLTMASNTVPCARLLQLEGSGVKNCSNHAAKMCSRCQLVGVRAVIIPTRKLSLIAYYSIAPNLASNCIGSNIESIASPSSLRLPGILPGLLTGECLVLWEMGPLNSLMEYGNFCGGIYRPLTYSIQKTMKALISIRILPCVLPVSPAAEVQTTRLRHCLRYRFSIR